MSTPSTPSRSDPAYKRRIRALYKGRSPAARQFRYGLLIFDLVTIAFIILTSFTGSTPLTEALNVVFGLLILLDFAARLSISRRKLLFLLHPMHLIDIAVIVSLLMPMAGEYVAFLRAARTLRLLRSYPVLMSLRDHVPFFQRHEYAIINVANLLVFIFVMTALVFETQKGVNSGIHNYVDALYFTVTTLTTTGFGDITPKTNLGRLLAVIIMIFGVSLFIRMLQAIFQVNKVNYSCPRCALALHDRDAVHCKHCGLILGIPDKGLG